jgi:diguanylate cyclase (GGDEF)-like protein
LYRKRNRLILLVSLTLVAGFLLTSLASYFVSIAAMREQIISHELPLTGDSVYSEVQRDLLRPIYLSSLMAHDTFLRDWVVDGEHDPDQMTRYLKEIQEKYHTFTSFFVSEASRTYYQADGILKKVKEDEPRDRWYFRVREMKKPYEINVDPDMAHDDAMTIFINYRVFDRQGNYIGATGVGLMVYAVRDILARYKKQYGCTVLFTNQDGRVVLHAKGAKLPSDDLHTMPGMADIAGRILAGHSGPLRCVTQEGTVHVDARFVKELDWYLVSVQPEARKLRGIRHALFANLGICAIITTFVLIFTNMTIGTYQRRIERLATTDSLTGLHNRQAFDILFGNTLQDLRRRQTEGALLLLDLDNFKTVNDTFGHVAGDAVLRELAKVLRGAIRASDILCRWGGEEFLVVLRDCQRDHAIATAEKIRAAVEAQVTVHGPDSIRTTASVGATPIQADEDMEDILHRADEALYLAKEKGRNRVETA